MRNDACVLALSFFLVGVGMAHAANLVVVESDAPGLQAGQVIDDAVPLQVPAGAHVVLVAESGTTLTLTGPFSGVPVAPGGGAPSGSSLVSALSNLLQTGGTQTSSLGAMKEVRPSDAPIGSPAAPMGLPGAMLQDPWTFDTGHETTYCLPVGTAATLWRADTDDVSVLRLEAEVSGQRADLTWPAGQAAIDWPAALPLMDGAGYMVSVETGGGAQGSGGVVMMGAGSGHHVVVRFVPADLPTEAHRVAWMAENGCEAQARRLLATLR